MSSGDPRQVRAAMRAMETHLQGLVAPAEQRLRDAETLIRRAEDAYEEVMVALKRALDQAEADLDYCLSLEDEDGRRPDCSPYYRRCQELRDVISQFASLGQQFEQDERHYQIAAKDLQQIISHDIPKATHWLRDKERALEKFENDSVGIRSSSSTRPRGGGSGSRGSGGPSLDALNALGAAAITTGHPTLLSAFNSFFEGMGGHGYKYQKARQEYLRSLVNDPNQPKHVRGWVKQELNRIEAAKRANAAGLQPPGGSARNLRGIPGLDVGHRFPGLDHPANFRLEDVWVNRHRPIVAKRLGISHLFR